ncbi:outer membrane protein assembly factor BamC [Endozoicomonas sp. SCSIO W0465]|uniref:outer membrane protein assembly factor BamC n=1 Tax=Endozoicomonas sp. SCSIO W0465 TaxID=2918516 RepID=UPI002075930B|nr:outer membrane protein assembly factor BamC [Endozoicomonas sp. SCSIO W0465]USE38728.1 outer membrane protein assembly factor BamC [Endozoicomonas sp. SCSIO W0465]
MGLSVAISALVLTGCANPFGQQGYLRDRAGDYTEAKVAKPVTLPAESHAKALGDVLVIPEAGQSGSPLSRDFEVPRPSQRLMMKEGDHYSIERNGGQEWLSVDREPSEVWPGVLAYIDQLGVGISTKDVTTGVVETQWNDFGNDKDHGVMYRTLGKLFGVDDLEPMQDRFRFEVRNGLKAGSTEVYVYHQGRPLPKKGKAPSVPLKWDNLEERSQRLDNGILAELLVFLARNEVKSSVSLQAQALDVGALAEIGQDGNGNPVLTVRGLSYARVWDSVSSALDKAGLKVVDRNRSAGLFYLADAVPQLKQPEKKKSFWSGWFSDEEEADVADEQKTLTIRVSNYSEVVQLSVEKDVNTSAPTEVSQRLLKVIRDNLQ